MEPMKYSIFLITCMESTNSVGLNGLDEKIPEVEKSVKANLIKFKKMLLDKLKTPLDQQLRQTAIMNAATGDSNYAKENETVKKEEEEDTTMHVCVKKEEEDTIHKEQSTVEEITKAEESKLAFFKSNIEAYYCFPMLFTSLCHVTQKQIIATPTYSPEKKVLQAIKQSNMMLLYSKSYQLEKYRVLWALRHLDSNYLSKLNEFFQCFSLQISDLNTLQKVEYREDVDANEDHLDFFKQSVLSKLEQYFELDFQRFAIYQNQHDPQLLQTMITKVKRTQPNFFNTAFKISKSSSTIDTYEVVSEMSDYLFQQCVHRNSNNDPSVLNQLMLFSFYIRVYLYEHINQLLPNFPTEQQVLELAAAKLKKLDDGTVKEALKKVENELKKNIFKDLFQKIFKDRFATTQHVLIDCMNRIFDDFCQLINTNVGNTSGSIKLLDNMLLNDKFAIETLSSKLSSLETSFKKLYDFFTQSKQVFMNLVNIPMEQITEELLQIPLLFPTNSQTGNAFDCYADCKLAAGGILHKCDCCKKWFHLECSNEKKHESLTRDEINHLEVCFCYICHQSLHAEENATTILQQEQQFMETESSEPANKKQKLSNSESKLIFSEENSVDLNYNSEEEEEEEAQLKQPKLEDSDDDEKDASYVDTFPSSSTQQPVRKRPKRDNTGGFSCHQCKVKTTRRRGKCCNAKCTSGSYCESCLLNRYGENIDAVLQNPKWECPRCRLACNCSTCRSIMGMNATSPVNQAKKKGYNNVSEMLQAEK